MGETTRGIADGLVDLMPGDSASQNKLFQFAYKRLRVLSRTMQRRFPRLRSRVETDDVLHSAAIRLRQSLLAVTPQTVPEFFGLAALQIRRELLELIRQRPGPELVGTIDATDQVLDAPGQNLDNIEFWKRFADLVDELPPREREVVDLHVFAGLTLAQIAKHLEVDKSTAKLRWRIARIRLAGRLKDTMPDV
jgi:RNA polymerase sigma factor (sigma-70 family)